MRWKTLLTPATANSLSPETKERIKNTVLSLPKQDGWLNPLYLYQGFWSSRAYIEGDILAHQYFKAEPSDIFVGSVPKCGTTWLKALSFAIVTRTQYDNSTTPLLNKFAHDCVPLLPDFSRKVEVREPGLPLINTHVHYSCLPKSALDLGCKIVYICREPKDAFVSLYHFASKRSPEELSLEKTFDLFCGGKFPYGPFWEHVMGFWKASQERPQKVLFLKYEDMKKDTVTNVKRLAEFMGYPFSPEEQKRGAAHNIVELCSFENMRNLEVNKSGIWKPDLINVETKTFFRKGEVGDWNNWLAPEMAKRLDNIMQEKLNGSGLKFHN